MSWPNLDALNCPLPRRNNLQRGTAKGYIRFMAINRTLWKPPFAEFPSWMCPRCQSATLALDKDSLKVRETGPSIAAQAHDAWEPDWINETFSALLECRNPTCGELVAIAGRTHHEEAHSTDMEKQDWEREFEPLAFVNAPPVFLLSAGCPEEVAAELRKAFALIWSDKGSCANRLRSAVEALLTERGVPKTSISKKGKRVFLLPQARIEKFKIKNAEAAEILTAIKWLGNAGSHANDDELSIDELLDGFELFEHVLNVVYDKSKKRLKSGQENYYP